MVTNRLLKMAFIKSKKYGSSVQFYHKKNGDFTYYITYKDANNKLKRVKVGEKSQGITEHYCYAKRSELVNAIRLGEDPQQIIKGRKKRFTFLNAYEDYIIWAKGNKSSWDRDKQLFETHLKDLHNYNLVDLLPKHFEDLKQEKKLTLSDRTVEYMLAVARQIINHAIKNELIKSYNNPISGGRVKIPKPDNAKIAFLTQEQADELLEILKSKDSLTMYHLTVLLLYTGARFVEVATLTWNDINFLQRLIYFKSTKNGNARQVYMTDLVCKILQDLPKNTPFVITDINNNEIKRMSRQWQLIVDDMIKGNVTAEKYRITVHSLRHTHASWMALAGADILQIKEQLGHKKLDMTLRYAHLIPSQRHEVIKAIFDGVG
jgi:integrase